MMDFLLRSRPGRSPAIHVRVLVCMTIAALQHAFLLGSHNHFAGDPHEAILFDAD